LVSNICAPAILGNSSNDVATRNISTEKQFVELRNGRKVPILKNGAREGTIDPTVEAVCACPLGVSAQLIPAQKTRVMPGAMAHIPEQSTYVSQGMVSGKASLYHRHGLQVAQGPGIMEAWEPMTIQVMHLGTTPLRLTTRQAIGYIESHTGPTFEMSSEDMAAMSTSPQGSVSESATPESPGDNAEPAESLAEVHFGVVPQEYHEAQRALIRKHASLWECKLDLIKGVEHRIQLKPGSTPVRQHPDKAGPIAHAKEKTEVERMRAMGVIEPSTDRLLALRERAPLSLGRGPDLPR